MKRFIFYLILIFYGFEAHSQSLLQNDSALVYTFISIFENNGINSAIDYVYSTNKWMYEENNIDSAKAQINKIIAVLGMYYGHSLIKKAKLSNCLSTYSFIMRYDRLPLRFILVLYKPKDIWRFQLFNYDGNITEEMQNSKNVTWDF